MAVGGQDAKVTLYDFPSGKMLKTLVHFTLPIRHVAFSPDGQWVAVASE
jgi:chromosome transmission fidelity protein 4